MKRLLRLATVAVTHRISGELKKYYEKKVAKGKNKTPVINAFCGNVCIHKKGMRQFGFYLLNIIVIINTYQRKNKNPYPTSQLHTGQTNNKLYLYEKTNTTNKLLYDDYYQGDF